MRQIKFYLAKVYDSLKLGSQNRIITFKFTLLIKQKIMRKDINDISDTSSSLLLNVHTDNN